jgi:hypothetical protein
VPPEGEGTADLGVAETPAGDAVGEPRDPADRERTEADPQDHLGAIPQPAPLVQDLDRLPGRSEPLERSRLGMPAEDLLGRRADAGAADEPRDLHPYRGMRTLSMTWMTPLLARTSVLTTFAVPTLTPFEVSTDRLCPCTVFAELSFVTSAAITRPGTTW